MRDLSITTPNTSDLHTPVIYSCKMISHNKRIIFIPIIFIIAATILFSPFLRYLASKTNGDSPLNLGLEHILAKDHERRRNLQQSILHTSHPPRHRRRRSSVSGNYSIHNITTGEGLYVLPIPSNPDDFKISAEWADISMPTKSYFLGFSPPNNQKKWKIAQLQASRGEQILLAKMLQSIRSPFDMIENDNQFKWVHRIAEYHKAESHNFLEELASVDSHRALITMLGYDEFDRPGFEGHMKHFHGMGPASIINNKKFRVPRKIVAVGMMNENWGWLSSYFLNRTVLWGKVFVGNDNPFDKGYVYPYDQIKFLLNDPNVVALIVNQHHNCSHPKVLSMPMGISSSQGVKPFWQTLHSALKQGLKKKHLLFSAGSDYAYRPIIRKCIANNMGKDFEVFPKMRPSEFKLKIYESMFVLAMPGLGYDTYRLWETLYSGSIPVLEKGFGMERTLYRVPALFVDDFADITGPMLRQAYVEFLYRVDEWDYERLTPQYWERLLYDLADSGSTDALLLKHPMIAEDTGFTRPLIPFDCEALGGCGPGTKRTPKKSCAINGSVMNRKYNWIWH